LLAGKAHFSRSLTALLFPNNPRSCYLREHPHDSPLSVANLGLDLLERTRRLVAIEIAVKVDFVADESHRIAGSGAWAICFAWVDSSIFARIPTPRRLHDAHHRLAVGMDVNVLHRNLLLALAAVTPCAPALQIRFPPSCRRRLGPSRTRRDP